MPNCDDRHAPYDTGPPGECDQSLPGAYNLELGNDSDQDDLQRVFGMQETVGF